MTLKKTVSIVLAITCIMACMVALPLTASAEPNPIVINVDFCYGLHGSFRVAGWSYDPDESGKSLETHVYFDGPAGTPKGGIMLGETDFYRADVNAAFSIEGNHGYDRVVAAPCFDADPGEHSLYIYGVNGAKHTLWLFNNEVPEYIDYKAPFVIHYDANTGTDAPADTIKRELLDADLSEGEPQKTGYDFLGWSTDSSATEPMFTAGETITNDDEEALFGTRVTKYEINRPDRTFGICPNDEVTLYAVYAPSYAVVTGSEASMNDAEAVIEDNLGHIRFYWAIQYDDVNTEDPTAVGAYIIPWALFGEDGYDPAVVTYTDEAIADICNGKTFAADLNNIPDGDIEISAYPFVNTQFFMDKMIIDTVNNANIN